MPATVTLATTTLALPLDARQQRIKLASIAGVFPGMRLWFDRELVNVLRIEVSPWVEVQRGVDGTLAQPHLSSVTVYIGDPHQFYESDPTGRPPDAIPVSPHINVRNGKVWFAQGDTQPNGSGDRWWQEQAVTRGVGALGVRTTTFEPTSST